MRGKSCEQSRTTLRRMNILVYWQSSCCAVQSVQCIVAVLWNIIGEQGLKWCFIFGNFLLVLEISSVN